MKQEFATGIFNNDDIEDYFVLDNCINECFIEHCKTCKREEHDICWEDQPEDTKLHGYEYNEDTDTFDVDVFAEFQAIERGNTIQVCGGENLIVGCKMAFQGCYPGYQAYPDRGDLGGITAYSLPNEALVDELQPLVISVEEYELGKKSIMICNEDDQLVECSYEDLRNKFRSYFGENIYKDEPSAVYGAMLEYAGVIKSFTIESYSRNKEAQLPAETRAMLYLLRNCSNVDILSRGIGFFYDDFYQKINSNVLDETHWSQSARRIIKLAFNMFNGFRDSEEYDLYWLTRGLDSNNREAVKEAINIFLS